MAITNFNEETAPLNDLEKEAADIIARYMQSHHQGQSKAVTGANIGEGMAQKFPQFRVYHKSGDGSFIPYLNGPRIRKIINYLRTEGICPFIVSSSCGYFVSTDVQEIRDCIRSIKERASAISHVAQTMERYLREQYKDNQHAQMDI